MAALTGNSVGSSYLGLLKTSDNAAIDGTLKNMTDGAGNATPLSMANNYLQVQAPTIEFVESTGGTNLMMISPTNVYFEGAVDFTNASVTGIGGGAPGLVNGIGVAGGYNSLKVADALVNTNAQATAGGNIGIGENARATGSDAFARHNIAIGTDAQATSEASLAVGYNAQATSSRASAFGLSARATQANTTAIGRGAYANGSGVVAVGYESGYLGSAQIRFISIGEFSGFAAGSSSVMIGYNCTAKAADSVAIGNSARIDSSAYTGSVSIGHLSDALAVGAVALGRNVQASVAECTTVNMLQIANYANLNYADDTTAAAGGVALGQIYHTDGAVKVRTT